MGFLMDSETFRPERFSAVRAAVIPAVAQLGIPAVAQLPSSQLWLQLSEACMNVAFYTMNKRFSL